MPTDLPSSPCLEDLEVSAFVDGSAGDDQRAKVLGHVEGCAPCRELVEGLLGSDAAPATLEVQGPYRVLGLLAEGGMGRIYRARDTELDREVAIKVPRSNRPALLARFEREVTITARLQHPGIVAVHGAGSLVDGTPFYVMRFVDGTPLDALIARADRAARLALVQRVLDVAETMAFVHSKSIAHRDLKPNNILISQFDETLIIDWGLAKEVGPADAVSLRYSDKALVTDAPSDTPEAIAALTRAGDVLGTPAFMAPEQATGQAVDQRADVYALGGILSMIVTGELPTQDPSPEAPAALARVWTRAMAIDPAERYPDAGAFAAALRAALVPAAAPRRRLRWIAGGIALVAIAAAIVVWRGRGEPAPHMTELGPAPTQIRSVAVSPSGKRVAYSNFERVEVREVATGRTWKRFGWTSLPGRVEFLDDDRVTYAGAIVRGGALTRLEWNVVTDAVTSRGAPLAAMHWLGSIAAGDIVTRDWDFSQVAIMTAAGPRDVPILGMGGVTQVVVPPSRTRFAFFDSKNIHVGVVRVIDPEGRELARSPEIADLTALAWLDEETLIYATGSSGRSTVFAVHATSEGLARPTIVFEDPDPSRWIASLAVGGERIISVLVTADVESRMFGREDRNDVTLDSVAAAALLGWSDDGAYYTWNRNSEEIEKRLGANALPAGTGSKLRGDPANATRAGAMLIGALRDVGGRRIEAIRLGEPTPRWTRPPGVLAFVRCAGDVAAPCLAGVTTPRGDTELHRIDPETGRIGELVVGAGDLADVAIDRDGHHIAWLDGGELHIGSLDTIGTSTKVARISGPRTLAFDPTGGILLSVSDGVSRDIRRYHDGNMDVIAQSAATIISLVRPSPDGKRIGYRTRTFGASLAELHLAR